MKTTNARYCDTKNNFASHDSCSLISTTDTYKILILKILVKEETFLKYSTTLLVIVLLLLCVSQDDFTRWRQNWTWIYLQVSVCASCSQMVLFLPLLLFLLFLLFFRGEASSRHDGLGRKNGIRQQQLHQPGDCCVLRL